ncbi:TRAUB-domain-containing protein [Viridothelium virens]|uniref:Protein BFR2 n=1 Tax=Viridothelium virens TaxID=1048519 RepID=A0A6A6HNS2_VIRVR|nr:TRAUB-domain-containing protein [Viridothelium virens]
MSPARVKSLAERVAELDAPFRDHDPEDQSSSDNGNSDIDETIRGDGREHYQVVENSKLRGKDVAPLGHQYEGSRVSRDVAFYEEEDDPFAKGFQSSSSDEETYDESDDRARIGYIDGTEKEDEDEDEDEMEEEDDEEDTELSDGGAAQVEDDDRDGFHSDSRAELRRMMSEQQKAVTSSISQAAKVDAEKGRAVKQQRSTFNSLLNSRIRLQKALISTNSFELAKSPEKETHEDDEVVEAAENAAFRLWSSLNNLRENLQIVRTGEKRKLRTFEPSTPSLELWNHMEFHESSAKSYRDSVLNKWSAKTHTATATSNAPRLNPSNSQNEALVDILTSHLIDKDRLVKRARTARSCAPLQASLHASANSTNSAQAVYDDADFYSLLLKSLLEQTSTDIDTSALAIPNQWQLARQAKTKKVVDTKASKGRKMRYTVHEKLQNFMAPEDRGSWGDRQRDELFGGLLGMKAVLTEEQLTDEEGRDENGDLGDEGVMLFGR